MSNEHVDLVIVDDDPIIGKVLMRMLEGFDLNIHFYEDSTADTKGRYTSGENTLRKALQLVGMQKLHSVGEELLLDDVWRKDSIDDECGTDGVDPEEHVREKASAHSYRR